MFFIIKSELKGLVSPLMHKSHYLITFLTPVQASVTSVLCVDYAIAKPT